MPHYHRDINIRFTENYDFSAIMQFCIIMEQTIPVKRRCRRHHLTVLTQGSLSHVSTNDQWSAMLLSMRLGFLQWLADMERLDFARL